MHPTLRYLLQHVRKRQELCIEIDILFCFLCRLTSNNVSCCFGRRQRRSKLSSLFPGSEGEIIQGPHSWDKQRILILLPELFVCSLNYRSLQMSKCRVNHLCVAPRCLDATGLTTRSPACMRAVRSAASTGNRRRRDSSRYGVKMKLLNSHANNSLSPPSAGAWHPRTQVQIVQLRPICWES